MISALKGEIDIQKLPVDSEEHKFNSWKVKYKKSHILHSKCVNGPCQDDKNKCLLCIYNSELELPHLPDMVFPNNVMVLQHENGCGIEFNALDALRRVSNGKLSVKVACSEEWKESRQEHGNLDEVKPFDWTFTTDYMGTLLGNFIVKQTDERINVEKLRQREQILFYNDLTLFEDELHDNGIAVCSVKVRVMPSSFFVLLRYFLRVDNVMLRTNDTRLYHEFGTNFILREYTSRAAQASEIKHVAIVSCHTVEGQACENGFYCVNITSPVICSDGIPPADPVAYVCPPGTFCSDDCQLECQEIVPCTTTTTATLPTTTEEPFVCTSTGRFPDPTNCSNYYMCSPRSTGGFYQYLYNCPGGSFFNSVTRLCTLSSNVTCGTSSSSVSPTVTASPGNETTTTIAPFICTSAGRFINPVDCFQYYMCSLSANGTFYQYLYDCPTGAAFNPATNQCTASTTCV